MKKIKDMAQSSQQMLIVNAQDWNSFQATMQLYERDEQGKWSTVHYPFPVVLGRNGLAWGQGLITLNTEYSVQKKEGDGKSPAGIFALGEAFGIAPKSDVDWIRLPYLHITEKWECVDDVKSKYYNQLIERRSSIQEDWNTSEKMLAVGEEYRWGIVVKHNMNPVESGCGSCIFLHIWKDEKTGTAGCTAMERVNIEMLLRWLDPSKHPILVQLPEDEGHRMIDVLRQ